MNNKIVKRIVWIVSILGIFLIVKLTSNKFNVGGWSGAYQTETSSVANQYSQKNSSLVASPEILDAINTRLAGEIAKELKQNPDQTKSEALATAAIRAGSEDLQSGKGVRTKIEKAADQFLGFYSINAIFRSRYCENLGMPIPAFVISFQRANKDEYRIASAQWVKDAQRLGSAEERIKFATPILMPLLEQDMLDITKMMKVSSPKLACQEMQRQGDLYGEDMSLERVNPVLYAALHGR